MTNENATSISRSTEETQDLSDQIRQSIQKDPRDRVTCVRIYGDNYRCNWWSPASTAGYDNPRMAGLLVTTHRVRKSQFLNVTSTAVGLVIRQQPAAR